MRRYLIFLWTVSILVPSLALGVEKLKDASVQSDMVEVEADKLDVYKNKGEAFFQGNVWATKGDMLLKSNTLRLFYNNQTKKMDQFVAEGNVSIHWLDRDATCNKAIFQNEQRKVILMGNVVIVRGEERLTGQKVVMDMATDHQVVEGRGGRVKIKVKTGEGSALPW